MRARRSSRLGLVALAAAVFVLSAGCGSATSPNAYTVDGKSVSDHDFQRELEALRDNKDLAAAIKASSAPGSPKVARGTLDPRLTASWLQSDLQSEIVDREFARKHLSVSAAAKQQLTAFSEQYFSSKKTFDAFPKWFRELELRRFARLLTLLGSKPTDTELRKTFEDLKAKNCPAGKLVSHILVKTKPEADAIAAELLKGADFATTAAQKSTDTQSAQQGGQLGCLTPGQFVKPFEDAANALQSGTVSAPVQTQYGYHLIKVRDLTFESARKTVEDRKSVV